MEWLAVWFLVVVSDTNNQNAVSYSIPVSSKEECVGAAKKRRDLNNKDTQKNKYLCEVGKLPIYKADSRDVLHWQKTWYLAVVENNNKPNAVAYTLPLESKNDCFDLGQKRKIQNANNKYVCELGVLPYYAP